MIFWDSRTFQDFQDLYEPCAYHVCAFCGVGNTIFSSSNLCLSDAYTHIIWCQKFQRAKTRILFHTTLLFQLLPNASQACQIAIRAGRPVKVISLAKKKSVTLLRFLVFNWLASRCGVLLQHQWSFCMPQLKQEQWYVIVAVNSLISSFYITPIFMTGIG